MLSVSPQGLTHTIDGVVRHLLYLQKKGEAKSGKAMMIKQVILAFSMMTIACVGFAEVNQTARHFYICHQYQPMSHLPFQCFQCSATQEYAIHKASWSYIKSQHPYYACGNFKGDYNYHWFYTRAQADQWRWRHCHCG